MGPITRSAKKRAVETEDKDISKPAKKKPDVKPDLVPLSDLVHRQRTNHTATSIPKAATETSKKGTPQLGLFSSSCVESWRHIDWSLWENDDAIKWIRTFWSRKDDLLVLWEKNVNGKMIGKIVEYQMKVRANQELGQTTEIPPLPVKELSDDAYEKICSSFWNMCLHKLKRINM